MKALKYITLCLCALTLFSFTAGTKENFSYRQISNKAFTYGENLKYRVHFGWINAATIDINVAPNPVKIDDRTTYHITAKGRTKSSFDWMYKVRDHYETFLDSESMAPLKYFKSVRENSYKDKDLVYYDHSTGYIKGHKKDMDAPQYVQDLVSSLFYARTYDFENATIGETFPIDIYMDQEIYNLKFKYLGKETLKTDVGKVNCYVMRPQLVVDRVFKDEDDMTVWVTADANRIPVRVKTDIWVGSLKIDLTSYSGLANNFSSKR